MCSTVLALETVLDCHDNFVYQAKGVLNIYYYLGEKLGKLGVTPSGV